ncbi:hypothetical protein [Mycobacterium sp. 23]|uniref:hypothetical protein n=1 Tax=Mycobacterium sp. 23 TaxID=3400424 RepID=UPI003AB0F73B
MTDYRQTAALALAKCAAYDPWFPKASQALVDSWSEAIAKYKLGQYDVLAGVAKMYADNGSGFRPLPKDLTDAARAVRRERGERESEQERRAREDRYDAELAERNQNRLAALIAPIAESKGLPG